DRRVQVGAGVDADVLGPRDHVPRGGCRPAGGEGEPAALHEHADPRPPPSAIVPVASVPMKLPSITASLPDSRSMCEELQRLLTRPRMVTVPGLEALDTTTQSIELEPSISISGTASIAPVALVFGCEPGCVKPSRVSGAVMDGRPPAGTLVWTPLPAMSNAIVSASGGAFTSSIAARSVQAPPAVAHVPSPGLASGSSPVLSTVKVAAHAGAARSQTPAAITPRRVLRKASSPPATRAARGRRARGRGPGRTPRA